MQQYLSVNVLSITQQKESKDYVIKLRNLITSFTTQIDNKFNDGYEYVYQLWPCRRGSQQTIGIQLSTKTNGRTVIIGEASPTISYSEEGQKYKFYETEGHQNVIVLAFKVIKVSIPQDAWKEQQLRAMNNKMEIYLKQCKAELNGYKQFLYNTNNLIKQLNKGEQVNQYVFDRLQGESQQQQLQKDSKFVTPISSSSKAQEMPTLPNQRNQSRQMVKKDAEKYQQSQKYSSRNKNSDQVQPYRNLTTQNVKNASVKQQNKAGLQKSRVSHKSSIKQQIKSVFNTSKAMIKSQKSQMSQMSMLQPKKNEEQLKSLNVSNIQSKIFSSANDSLNQIKKKRNILSKFSYIQRSFTNNRSFINQIKQMSQQSHNQVNIKSRSKDKLKNNKGLEFKEQKKGNNQTQKNQLQIPNNKANQQSNQILNVTEEIKKRREAYKNLQKASRKSTIQVPQKAINQASSIPSVTFVPQAIRNLQKIVRPQIRQAEAPKAPKTPKKPQTPIAELTISAVKQYQSQHSQKHGLSIQRASQFKSAVKRQSTKNQNPNQSIKNYVFPKILQGQVITGRKSLQNRLKGDSFKQSNLSLYKQKQSPLQHQKVIIEKQQDEAMKQNRTTDVTDQSQSKKSQSIKMEFANQNRAERRKKHSKVKTQVDRESVVGSTYHIQAANKNNSLSKHSQKSARKKYLDMKKLIMRIWSIRVTTLTLGQARSRRCLIENGANKFQTNIKQAHENSVQWDDKITIKNIQPSSCLYLTLASFPYKNMANEGCGTILMQQLLGSKSTQHKAYLYKDNLAIGNFQLKFTIQEQESQRPTFSLPEIKKQGQDNNHSQKQFENPINLRRFSRQAINTLESSLQAGGSKQAGAWSFKQSQTYNSKIKQEKKRRYLIQ